MLNKSTIYVQHMSIYVVKYMSMIVVNAVFPWHLGRQFPRFYKIFIIIYICVYIAVFMSLDIRPMVFPTNVFLFSVTNKDTLDVFMNMAFCFLQIIWLG